MRQILGDNQFFGINHNDLDKAESTKAKFSSNEDIISFISQSLMIGLDGFMMNSNDRGYNIVSSIKLDKGKEIHYSVPYPHKFATMVNEQGMLELFKYALRSASFNSLFRKAPKFLITRNIKDLLPLIIELELPHKLEKGSYVYLQNIVTDLVLGMKRDDLLLEFCEVLIKKGFKPGLITLNPLILEKTIAEFPVTVQSELVVCFNINKKGFNVFPNLNLVETFIGKDHYFKKMGMSILSSGGVSDIPDAIQYIKNLKLDYVVYGSSKIKNVQSNFDLLKA
ncbi:hypothetical protein [Algoriphagus sediminis]|uniref:Uncharacterized protein n=1 Tax=Algoriphagus sediminis TaxID=3057113 RepID=A0ABT7YDQ5_9BACT|nr:hypothetical protein [Algoriphagus sediminis]MDN3204665.1 hypothetical protein [Algoriphagus sediminis]